jgi:transcriptional regulator with XRE-family HTH domain
MKNLDRIRSKMSATRRCKVTARAKEILAEEMTLRELRKARSRTQTRIGELLGIGQDGVSRIEQRSDLLISTLRNYVEAMGGKLKIVVEFPDHKPVVLSGISAIDEYRVAPKARSRPALPA